MANSKQLNTMYMYVQYLTLLSLHSITLLPFTEVQCASAGRYYNLYINIRYGQNIIIKYNYTECLKTQPRVYLTSLYYAYMMARAYYIILLLLLHSKN